MIKIINLFCVGLVALSIPMSYGDGAKSSVSNIIDRKAYTIAVATARKMHTIDLNDAKLCQNLADQIDRLNVSPDNPAYGVSEFVRCSLLMRVGKQGKAKRGFVKLLSHKSVLPETIHRMEFFDYDHRFVLWNAQGVLLPLSPSIVRSVYEGRVLACGYALKNQDIPTVYAFVQPSPILGGDAIEMQSIPKGDHHNRALLKISDRFESVQLYERAYSSYLSYVYAEFGTASCLQNGIRVGQKVAFCPEASSHWKRVAELAYKAGKTKDSLGYLAKSAILAKEFEPVAFMKAIDSVLKKLPAEKKPADEILKKDILALSELFKRINAHPAAWAILEQHTELFGGKKAVELETKSIKEEWVALLKPHRDASPLVILYDYKIYPNGDPLKVKILQAMSAEAIKKVNKQLKEFLSKQAAAQPLQPKKSSRPKKQNQ